MDNNLVEDGRAVSARRLVPPMNPPDPRPLREYLP